MVLLFFQICFPFVHLLCSSLFTPFLTISLTQLRISAPHTVLKAPFFDKLFGTLSSSCYPSIDIFHDTVWFMCHMYQISPFQSCKISIVSAISMHLSCRNSYNQSTFRHFQQCYLLSLFFLLKITTKYPIKFIFSQRV